MSNYQGVDPAQRSEHFTSFLPDYVAGKVLQVDDEAVPVFVDETVGFNDAADANFTPFPAVEAIGDYCAIGFDEFPTSLRFDNANGTAGVGGVVVWEYWKTDDTWAALAGVTDGTTGFTIAVADGQTLTFTKPTDAKKRRLNGGPDLFYIRARITTVYSTNPVYDQGFIVTDGLNLISQAGMGRGARKIYCVGAGDVAVVDESDGVERVIPMIADQEIEGRFRQINDGNTTATALTVTW